MNQSIKRIYLALGGLCILTGAVLLGVAAYGILHDESSGQWIYVRPSLPSASPGVAGAVDNPSGVALDTEPYRLVIQKLGVDAPVATYGLDQNSVPEVPYEAQLVAWYNFSSYPGAGDNAVFAGHKTWRGEAVFFKLEELANGDEIVLQADDGARLVYRVSDMLVVDTDDRSALEWMQSTGRNTITLITCGGERFFTNTPAGADYTHRVLVRADLVDGSVASAQSGG
jgi:LPXTG-site transpeptidase (sortase) family protein